MILSQIVAISENRMIGIDNKLPWHIPEDLKFFKEKTKNSVLIMGRKTFESLPKPLPHRAHIVITRNSTYEIKDQRDDSPVFTVSSLEEAYQKAESLSTSPTTPYSEEVFVVGGGEIYRQSLSQVDRIYLTLVHKKITGDTSYPEINEDLFDLTRNDRVEEPIPHTYKTFERLKKQ